MFEVIAGAIPAKANHYMSVPGGDGGRRIIKDAIMRSYEASFRRQCVIYKDRHISCRFRLYVDVWFVSERSDLDNCLKGLLDLLQDVHAIENDNLCREIIARKHIDPKNPRIRFAIEEDSYSLFG